MSGSSRHLLVPSPATTPSSEPPSSTAAAAAAPTTAAAAHHEVGLGRFGAGSHDRPGIVELELPPLPPRRSDPARQAKVDVSQMAEPRSEHWRQFLTEQEQQEQQEQLGRSRSLHSQQQPVKRVVHHVRSASSQEIYEPQRTSHGSRRLRKDSSFRSTRAPSHRVGIARNPSVSGAIPVSGKIDELSQRVVFINDPGRTNDKYELAGNKIRTSKYSWYSFLPRNLFEQFRRLAYVYFLVIAVLNQIPMLAVFGRTASLIPLAVVLFVTAVKDGYEDWARHRSDIEENNRLAAVFHENGYKPKKWKKIQVGELVRVCANETIPCDMVLLGTSDSSGVAYVQTINLDGESNLKSRYAHQETLQKHPEKSPVNGVLHCEHPNRNIYEFKAFLDLDSDDPNGIRLPMGSNNILLRGCELKNTEWVVGLVVYAGQETKAMLNSSGAQSKRSKLEQKMNRETLWLSAFLVILCLVGGVGTLVWIFMHHDELDMLPYYKKTELDEGGEKYMYYGRFGEAVIAFLSCVISFQVMIPLSLYISMELVRLGQTYFMVRDLEMFHSDSDTRFQCRALNINEDLGQIDYIFSDKTGTLTENKMEFHSASISGVKFGCSRDSIDLKHQVPKSSVTKNAELLDLLKSPGDTREKNDARNYLLVLAACNTVVPTWVNLSTTGQLEMETASAEMQPSGYVEYQGESPDEQALVAAAATYGYRLVERTASSIVIDIHGSLERFEIIGVHEFDSVRKRMSIVVECPDKTVKLLVKGADTHMLNIISPSQDGDNLHTVEGRVRPLTKQHLTEFAESGLRTLVVASRELSQSDVEKWRKQYVEASTALVDRTEMLHAAASTLENSLTLLGACGIEDKLQDGVPEAIACLREAGLKVWVLTGDKQETAISIGFSSALLTQDMQQIIINENNKEACRNALLAAKAKHGIVGSKVSSVNTQVTPQLFGRHTESREKRGPLALIIDGNSLVHALAPDLNQELFELAVACQVVLCCRVAPYQKAAIVTLMKKKDKAMALSIGDGANDVAMIQAADIGVGISGQEGRQAVMASDYAMAQFRFLTRLLLIHGHWNYQRLAYMVLYNFYRNAVFVMLLFWYILYTAFSSQAAIFDWNLIFYSLFYTAVPTIVVGIFDKDVSHKTLLKYPPLYWSGRRNESYSQKLFWLTMLDTLWQSLVLFYVPFLTYRESTIDIWSLGSLWAIAVVILVNLHLAMDVQTWNWIVHLAIWGSILFTYVCLFILDSLKLPAFVGHYWVIHHAVTTATYWLDLVLVTCVALLPRFLVKVVRQRCCPTDIHIAREAEVLCKQRRPDLSSEVELQQRRA